VTVSEGDRAAMLRKYRLLARWRSVRDRSAAGGPDRAALRAMADEFPGALRELDVLGAAELLRRVEHLAGEGDGSPWLPWIVAYHRLMKVALVAKRTAGRTRQLSAGALPPVLAGASGDGSLDEALARKAARPAAGRLSVVVLRALGEHFGVPVERISTTLFPPRRPRLDSLD